MDAGTLTEGVLLPAALLLEADTGWNDFNYYGFTPENVCEKRNFRPSRDREGAVFPQCNGTAS
jgi:hypothetical protein